MFAKLAAEYKKISQKTKFISQLGAFLISIFSILSLYELARFFYFDPKYLNQFIEESRLFPAIVFQALIFIIFVARFVTLFFKADKTFWLSQCLSLIGLILLVSYWLDSRLPDSYYKSFHGTVIFRHASSSLEYHGLYYLLFSPIRKILTFFVALFKSK